MTETNAPKIVIALCTMTAISLIFMVLRFFCKWKYGRRFSWDDVLLALSWVFLVLYTSLMTASASHGIGKHMVETSMLDLSFGLKLLYIAEFFAIISITVSKTSFAVTLLRLSTKNWQRYLIWFVIITLNLIMGSCALVLFVQCSPVRKLWDFTAPGKCWDPHGPINLSIFAGSYSAAMDFILAIFPSLIIWKLQIGTKEKVGIVVAMSLGVLAGITAVVKTSYLPSTARWKDFTWSSAPLIIWAASETAVTIVAASIPFLRRFVKDAVSKGSKAYSNGYRLDNVSSYQSRVTAVRTSKRGISELVAARRQDDGSDKSILGESNGTGNEIIQTYEVLIEYQNRGDEEARGSEGSAILRR